METINATSSRVERQNTVSILKDVVASVAPVDVSPAQIADDANLFEQCGIDSVSSVELFIAIETRFNIDCSEAELDTGLFKNLSELARFVDSKLAQ